MACTPLPKVPLPTLPGGLSLTPPQPSASFNADLCCKMLPVPLATPAAPLPPLTINPGVIAIVNQVMSQITTFLNSLTIPCPKE